MSEETGVLWWLADDGVEAAYMAFNVISEGGEIVRLEVNGSGTFDLAFEINRSKAVEMGWADSVTSEEWVEEY